ncbi:MAG: response regulator transcription factor [Nitrospira sp.]|nr:response regulator transcription factor [Nitrospira sp.]
MILRVVGREEKDRAMASHDTPQRVVERVMIVDDHAMIRTVIRSMLAGYTDIQIVGEASNGVEAIMLMEQLHPSIVLMDINMPRMNGIEATTRITSEYPQTMIIGLSVHADGENQALMTAY